jgi:hypothetical protein
MGQICKRLIWEPVAFLTDLLAISVASL